MSIKTVHWQISTSLGGWRERMRRPVMIMMWPPFGHQTELELTSQNCAASEVVHQEPHTLSAQCCKPNMHGVRPTTRLVTEQGLLPCRPFLFITGFQTESVWRTTNVRQQIWKSINHTDLYRRDSSISMSNSILKSGDVHNWNRRQKTWRFIQLKSETVYILFFCLWVCDKFLQERFQLWCNIRMGYQFWVSPILPYIHPVSVCLKLLLWCINVTVTSWRSPPPTHCLVLCSYPVKIYYEQLYLYKTRPQPATWRSLYAFPRCGTAGPTHLLPCLLSMHVVLSGLPVVGLMV